MRWAVAAIPALFLVIYLPDAGRGFIADDYRWIIDGRIQSPADLVHTFTSNVGFYRPVVSLSFAADYALWGSSPRGYGLTNIGLCLLTALALSLLARRLGLAAAGTAAAAAIWLFNFHAVNMAVLWLSGRTALLVTLFALATAHAVLRGRAMAAGVLCFLALLCKEEAVALPALFTVAHAAGVVSDTQASSSGFRTTEAASAPHPDEGRAGSVPLHRRISRAHLVLPMWAALAIYVVLRWQSGAFWPADAPDHYQFVLSPGALARNVAEYADRSASFAAAVTIVIVLATRVRLQHLGEVERRVVRFAALWVPATFVLTVALPVRSSLYALLPSAGVALAAGAVASAASRAAPVSLARTALSLLVVVALLVPVYRSRNVRWVEPAEVAERAMRTLEADAAGRRPGHVVLIDAAEERFNLTSAFGNLFPEAVQLRLGTGWSGEILEEGAEPQSTPMQVYRLREGRLVRRQETGDRR